MSRSYREYMEAHPGLDVFYAPSGDDRQLAEMRYLEQDWLRDQAAQAEYLSWLDTLRDERN
jgi:hypothetical protein